ncbi:MAG: hypothetical protein K0Q51_1180 [Rickettsiaceae bacterium]|jgi:hypothetical protein|nr:hypothetical protein [Rickettsiaceae bacterium]
MPLENVKTPESDLNDSLYKLMENFAKDYETQLLIRKKGLPSKLDNPNYDRDWIQEIQKTFDKYMEEKGLNFRFKNNSQEMRGLVHRIKQEIEDNPVSDENLKNDVISFNKKALKFADAVDGMHLSMKRTIKAAKKDVEAKVEGKTKRNIDVAIKSLITAAQIVLCTAAILTTATLATILIIATSPISIPLLSAIGCFEPKKSSGNSDPGYDFFEKIVKAYKKPEVELKAKLGEHASSLRKTAEEIKGLEVSLEDKYKKAQVIIEPKMKNKSYVKKLQESSKRENEANSKGVNITK